MSEEPKKKRKLDRQRIQALLGDAWELIWRSRRRLLLGAPLLLINRLTSIVLPWLTKVLIDDVIAKGHHELLWQLAIASAGAAAIGATTDYALAQILGMAAQRSITDLRVRIQQHVQRLPVRYFDDTKTGVLVSRVMNDAEGIRNLVGTGLLQLFGGVVTAAIATGILFYLSSRLAAIVFIAFFVFGGVLAWAFKTARPMFKQRGEVNAQIIGRLTEGFSGIRIVKAYTAEKHEARVFAGGVHKLLRLVLGTMRVVSGVGAMTTFLIGLVGVAVLLVGGREVIAHRMTVGGLISFTLYLALVVGPVVQIVSIGTQLSEAFAGLERMREILAEAREDAADPTKTPVASIDGNIELREVSFEYTPGVPVLKEINLFATAGQSIALVGPSGSGKSTLISLVAAFHRPTSGEIFVDGIPLGDLRLHDYRGHMGIVPQDSFLFADTIYNNIAYGNRRARREDVEAAAERAYAHDFIRQLPHGYQTRIGEAGAKLSGGQKQRLALARAMLRDPRILILDEFTSQTDAESEALIHGALREFRQGRTTFVITHRLNTLEIADRIVVVDNGRVAAVGTHAELMKTCQLYQRLHEAHAQRMVA